MPLPSPRQTPDATNDAFNLGTEAARERKDRLSLRDRMDIVEAEVAALRVDVDDHESRLDNHNDRLTAHGLRLDALEGA